MAPAALSIDNPLEKPEAHTSSHTCTHTLQQTILWRSQRHIQADIHAHINIYTHTRRYTHKHEIFQCERKLILQIMDLQQKLLFRGFSCSMTTSLTATK